jgi:hypothetical protein
LAGNVALVGATRNEKGFVGKPEEKRTLGRPRRVLEDNVKDEGCGLEYFTYQEPQGIYRIQV